MFHTNYTVVAKNIEVMLLCQWHTLHDNSHQAFSVLVLQVTVAVAEDWERGQLITEFYWIFVHPRWMTLSFAESCTQVQVEEAVYVAVNKMLLFTLPHD